MGLYTYLYLRMCVHTLTYLYMYIVRSIDSGFDESATTGENRDCGFEVYMFKTPAQCLYKHCVKYR